MHMALIKIQSRSTLEKTTRDEVPRNVVIVFGMLGSTQFIIYSHLTVISSAFSTLPAELLALPVYTPASALLIELKVR